MSRRIGRLIAGAAAAAVVAGATGCGIPTANGPTPIAKGNLPVHLLDPTTPSTVSSTVPPVVGVPVSVFMVAPNQHVIAVTRNVAVPATLSEILGALLNGPTASERAAGYQSFLTPSTQVSATVAAGIATVNFTTNPIQVFGPNQTLAIAQVVYTATEPTSGVTAVVFQIAGQPRDVPTAAGALVPGPVDRTAYAPQAPAP